MRRLNREIDLASFVRKQLIISGLIYGLTNPGQRALMRRSYNIVMPGAHDGPSTTDSTSDFDFKDYNPTSKLDHVLVNRLSKNSRHSQEPVDKK